MRTRPTIPARRRGPPVLLRSRTAYFVALILTIAPVEVRSDSKADLSKAMEQARRPVETQEAVSKDLARLYVSLGWSVLGSALCDGDESTSESSPPSYARLSSREVPVTIIVKGPVPPDTPPETHGPWSGIRSLQIWPQGDAIEQMWGGGLSLGELISPRTRVELSISYFRAEIRRDSPAYEAIKYPSGLNFELRTRGYVSRRHAEGRFGLFGLSYSLNFACTMLGWKYRNPIFAVDADGLGYEVSSDGIYSGAISTGIALTPIHSRYFTLNLDVGAGWRMYWFWTDEWFRNDIFSNSTFLQASVEVAVGF